MGDPFMILPLSEEETHVLECTLIYLEIILMNNKTIVHRQQVFISASKVNEQPEKTAD